MSRRALVIHAPQASFWLPFMSSIRSATPDKIHMQVKTPELFLKCTAAVVQRFVNYATTTMYLSSFVFVHAVYNNKASLV